MGICITIAYVCHTELLVYQIKYLKKSWNNIVILRNNKSHCVIYIQLKC